MLHALALFAATASPGRPGLHVVDVVISAGHEGRPASCERFPKRACNLGAPGERAWTPIVANEATKVLRAHGVRVARLPADFYGTYRTDAAVFVHFDGNVRRCSTGASIGYPHDRDRAAADLWRKDYGRYAPFRFMPDNFTVNLHHYYGFRQVRAKDGALVLEMGEIDCPVQKAWMRKNLPWIGSELAYFLSQLTGKGHVPPPRPPETLSRRPAGG